MKKLCQSSIAVAVLALFNISCSSFGTSPDEEQQKHFSKYDNYDSENKVFVNRRPKITEGMEDRIPISWFLYNRFISPPEGLAPEKPMPQQVPDIDKFVMNKEELNVIWLGHSSFLLNMNGKVVLVDPVFSNAAAPVSFLVTRYQEPVIRIEDLPKVDYVLISHDHYDHLDMDTSVRLAKTGVKFVTPLGVGSHLRGWGVKANQIIEKGWWEEASFDGIKFIATPSQHFSGRGLSDKAKTLWASWVIQSKDHNVYFSGDSGYDTHFKTIGEKLGPFDVAFIESGQYHEKWEEVHLLPEQGVQAYKDLNAKKYFPIHWGMFTLSLHTWQDPVEQLSMLSKNEKIDLVIPQIGEMVDLKKKYETVNWWSTGLINSSNALASNRYSDE